MTPPPIFPFLPPPPPSQACEALIARLREDNINFPVVPKAETLKKWLDEAVSKRMAYTKGDFTGDGNDPFLQAFGSRFDPTELNVALDNSER